MPEPTNGPAVVDVDEHPEWCDPKECMAGGLPVPYRHRSAPMTLELCNDLTGAWLDARMTESVFTPGALGFEVDVRWEGEDEPEHKAIISLQGLARMNRLTLSLMVRAIIEESLPVRPLTGLEL